MHSETMVFVHIRMHQSDEESFLDVYSHIFYAYHSVRLRAYLIRGKKKSVADKMKFSLVNEKEIYQSTKTKNLENTPVYRSKGFISLSDVLTFTFSTEPTVSDHLNAKLMVGLIQSPNLLSL